MRPVRVSIAAVSGIGDALPRPRPSFATWSNVSTLAAIWCFTASGALLAAVIDRASEDPAFAMVIATGLTLFVAVPITVGATFAPSLRPIRDLAEGTERVAAGDYSQRLPVVQDDDLGALAASFNRMQAGLAERERLQAAFGSYVDPALATRLLEQGDDIFTGERREVTVLFVDIRDFTPFAEANTAEDTVSHLNALFEIVVPAVLDAGGHVNKYLGDGALAVFGAPTPSPTTPTPPSPPLSGSVGSSPSVSTVPSGSASGSTPAKSSPAPSAAAGNSSSPSSATPSTSPPASNN